MVNIKLSKTILSNTLYLSAIQFANYCIPLVVVPFVIRIAGIAQFGDISFILALNTYFMLLADFGFNFIGVSAISRSADSSREELSSMYSVIMTIKIIVIGALMFVYFGVALFLGKYSIQIMIISFLQVLGTALCPIWFFQGMQRMQWVTVSVFCSKLIFLIALYLFLNENNSVVVYIASNSIAVCVSAIISLLVVRYVFHVKLTRFEQYLLFEYIKKGFSVCLCNFFSNIYSSSGVVLIGLFGSSYEVGLFSAADKIFKAFQLLMMPFAQAVFPRLASAVGNDKLKAKRFFLKVVSIEFVAAIILACLMFALSDILAQVIAKDIHVSLLVKLFSIVLVFSWLSYGFGVQGLIAFQKQNILLIIMTTFSLIHVFLTSLVIRELGYQFTPVVLIFTESMIACSAYLAFRKIT